MKPPNEAILALVEQLPDRLGDRAILLDVEAVYADVEVALQAYRPVCNQSGRCCLFAKFGHCLFVTTPELVYFLSNYRPGSLPPDSPTGQALIDKIEADPAELCPLQVGRLCGVRDIRPLGCRLFFCQPGSEKWGRPLYETFQQRMKAICRERSLPYAYVEWTETLAKLMRGNHLVLA
jgi:hypothetical protein